MFVSGTANPSLTVLRPVLGDRPVRRHHSREPQKAIYRGWERKERLASFKC